jgi:hypothetical protein
MPVVRSRNDHRLYIPTPDHIGIGGVPLYGLFGSAEGSNGLFGPHVKNVTNPYDTQVQGILASKVLQGRKGATLLPGKGSRFLHGGYPFIRGVSKRTTELFSPDPKTDDPYAYRFS